MSKNAFLIGGPILSRTETIKIKRSGTYSSDFIVKYEINNIKNFTDF